MNFNPPVRHNEAMKNAALLLLPLALSACTLTRQNATSGAPTPTATYIGPLLPAHQSALLYCDRNLLVKSIDGNGAYQRGPSNYCNFSLVPGLHLITLSNYNGAQTFTLPFDLQAGKTYTLRATPGGAMLKELPTGTAYNSAEALTPQP